MPNFRFLRIFLVLKKKAIKIRLKSPLQFNKYTTSDKLIFI
jgi:hypothetical protein